MGISGKAGEQLRMFMSPREVMGYVDRFGDAWTGSHPAPPTDETVQSHKSFRRKRIENGASFPAEVAAEGIKSPLTIHHGDVRKDQPGGSGRELWDGHHRFVAQYDADPDRLMPIEHKTYKR